MTATLLERLNRELLDLRELGRHRTLKPASGIDFSSNDYLGLARHPALAGALLKALRETGQIGSGGSRLLRGTHALHRDLEEAAARFFSSEGALYFNSGFDANLALFSSLPSRRAAIILDERVHASVKEGARASFARKFVARHNDPGSMEKAIRRARTWGAREVFLAAESVYSMEGDLAPLRDILALVERYEATVILDEAHATGIFGPTGRGLSEACKTPSIIALHTCGKALGASGALIAAVRVVSDYLVNTARPFLYSTASPPTLAAVVRRALALVDEEPERRKRLLALAAAGRELLMARLRRWKLLGCGTQILPILIGDERTALEASHRLQARGFDVRAIRTPTVPPGSARLRISLSAERSEEELLALAQALEAVEAELA